jgi:hypothetical protein
MRRVGVSEWQVARSSGVVIGHLRVVAGIPDNGVQYQG